MRKKPVHGKRAQHKTCHRYFASGTSAPCKAGDIETSLPGRRSRFTSISALLAVFPLTASGEIIELTNGDILNATIARSTEHFIIIEHPVLGRLTIDNSRIAEIRPGPEETAPAQQAASNLPATVETTEDQQETVDPGLFGSGFLAGWERNLSAGLSGTSGSSNNASFRGDIKINYKDKEKRWNINMFYYFASEDNSTTDNRFTTNLLREWSIEDSDWFYFTNGGYDWDQFKDWDHRIRLGGGSGYRFINTDSVDLSSKQGMNVNYSLFREQKNTLKLEALLGIFWHWKISSKQGIDLSSVLYPALTNLGEYRNVTKFEWLHSLDYYHGLAIKLGFRNEYDSTESDKNDLRYYLNIVWGL